MHLRARWRTACAAVVLSTAGVGIPGGTANAASIDGSDLTEPVSYVSLPAVLVVTNGTGPSVAPTVGLTNGQSSTGTANASTDAIVSSNVSTSNDAGYAFADQSGGTGGYDCVYNHSQSYFYAGRPVGTYGSTNKYQWRWQFFPYTQYYARQISGTWKWQEEICAVGGADGQNGYRTLYNASIMATNSTNTANRIGLKGDTNGDTTATSYLTISANAGPVTISGNLPTGGGGTDYAQYGQPKYSSPVDAYGPTESFGGWKAGCTYSRTCGSPNMQNQVHHGLFEFSHGSWNKSFPLDVQWNYYCADPFGVGCG